jgi:multidrug efflux pump subunit AcrA (membrane-fusion protein)
MADVAAAATPTPGGASPEGSTTPAAPQTTAPTTGTDTTPKVEAAAPPPEPRTYKRKINGKEESLNADEIDKAAKLLGLEPSDLLRGSQLAKAAYEKFEQARALEQRFGKYKDQDPWEVVRELKGIKDDGELDRLAEQRLIAKLQREAQMAQLTPEQQRYEQERQQYEAQRTKDQAERKAFEQQRLEAQAQAVRSQMEPAIIAEMEKAGLPKTTEAVRAVVNQLQMQHKYGIPLDYAAAVRDAQDQFIAPTSAILAKMGPEALMKALGKDAIDAILRHSIAQKGGPSGQAPAPAQPGPPAQPAKRTWMTTKEWDAEFLR